MIEPKEINRKNSAFHLRHSAFREILWLNFPGEWGKLREIVGEKRIDEQRDPHDQAVRGS